MLASCNNVFTAGPPCALAHWMFGSHCYMLAENPIYPRRSCCNVITWYFRCIFGNYKRSKKVSHMRKLSIFTSRERRLSYFNNLPKMHAYWKSCDFTKRKAWSIDAKWNRCLWHWSSPYRRLVRSLTKNKIKNLAQPRLRLSPICFLLQIDHLTAYNVFQISDIADFSMLMCALYRVLLYTRKL